MAVDYDSGGSGEASRLLTHAYREASRAHYSQAIALDTQAIQISPAFGGAYLDRSQHFMAAGRYKEAAGDLDRVQAMHPDDMSTAMIRVQIALRERNGMAAIAAEQKALHLPLRSFWHQPEESPGWGDLMNGDQYEVTGHMEAYAYMYESLALALLHKDDASVDDLARMVQIEHIHPEYLLARYCWEADMVGIGGLAELSCQEAIENNAHDIGQYDSLGFAHLLMAKWDDAIKDYDHAIRDKPDLAVSLYGRGIAKRHKGDLAGGNADIAAAQQSEPDIANIMHRLGAPAP